MFPLAGTAWEVLAARFVDRIGKGICDAPRDTLIADITPPAIRGAGYGIRRALDTAGRVCRAAVGGGPDGVLCPRRILVGACSGSTCGAPDRRGCTRARWHQTDSEARLANSQGELKRLSPAFWKVVAIGVVFTLARFSQAFLRSRRKPWRFRWRRSLGLYLGSRKDCYLRSSPIPRLKTCGARHSAFSIL